MEKFPIPFCLVYTKNFWWYIIFTFITVFIHLME
jgi:hypothetical protein